MGKFGAFDIIGPRMIGPSSSHTAGAARLSNLAWRIAGCDAAYARITLYGSFAETGRGHGTDKALVAGLLGMDSDDDRLRFSMLLAEEAGLRVDFVYSAEEKEYANSVKIEIESSTGEKTTVEGASIGGGNVLILGINGMPVSLSGEYPALIVHYEDTPGIISKVSDIIAAENINIAFMRVFRKSKNTEASMVLETDTRVPRRVAAKIEELSDKIYEVRVI